MNYAQMSPDPDDLEDWESEPDEGDFETSCINCGKPTNCDGCQCCGGPLCFYCSEVSAGFCDECLDDPEFPQLMLALTGGFDQ